MRPLFVSYRRDPWGQEVLAFSRECGRRGLRTIVDTSDPEGLVGQAQFDALRRIIRDESDGFFLYATRNIVESACIWNLEVPSALDRFDQGNFDFIPVFRDLSPADMAQLEPHGRRVSAMGGVRVGESTGAADDAVAAAHADAANLALARQIRRYSDAVADRPLRIAVRTREIGVQAPDADLLLDWALDYAQLLSGAVPGNQALGKAIGDVCRAVSAAGLRAIRIEGPGHLSAGLALGYTFPRPSGFMLEVVQQGAVWTADGETIPAALNIATQQLAPAGSDIVLTVAISRPEITRDVDAAVGTLGLPLGGRVVVLPEGGARRDAVLSDSHGRAIVREITETLMRVRSEWGTQGVIHVFMAAPFGLAVLLGHALNGFGRLCLYEPTASRDGYVQVLKAPLNET